MAEVASNVTDATIKEFYKKAVTAQQEVDGLVEQVNAARGRYRAVLKAAKAAGLDPDDISSNVKIRHMDRAELIRKERGRMRVLAVVGLWPKVQLELFGTDAPVMRPTAEDGADAAYDKGHQCGVKGEARTINPYPPGTEQWSEFDRGWSVGQEKNVPGKGRLRAKKDGNLKLVPKPEAAPEEAPPPEPLFEE